MALSLGATTPTALYLGTTAISAAYLGATQVYSTGGGDAYAIGGASPELVAAFTTQSDGTTAGEYYRKASSETTFDGLFTHSVSGLLTMFDSSGTLVWAPHNIETYSDDAAQWPSLSAGAGSPPVVTANAGEAPNGEIIADRVQFDRGGTASGDYSLKTFVSVDFAHAGQAAIWVKSNTGSNQTFLIYNNNSLGSTHTATTSWQRFVINCTGAAGRAVQIGTRGGTGSYFNGGDETLDLLVAHAGAYYTSPLAMADNPDMPAGLEKYVPTTTAAKYLPRRQAYRYNSGWELAGMQIEGAAATNLHIYSTDFSEATWNKGRGAITSDAKTGLDGNTGNFLFTVDTTSTGGASCRDDNLTAFTAVEHCHWGVFEAGASNWVSLDSYDGTINRTWFDLSTGTVGTTTGTNRTGIVSLGSGKYLCWHAWTAQVGTTLPRFFVPTGDGTLACQTGDSIYCFHMQCEAGSVPTSPIITNGSTVTRAAEILYIESSAHGITTGPISGHYRGISQVAGGGSNYGVLSIGNGTNVTEIYQVLGGTNAYLQDYYAGASHDDAIATTFAYGDVVNIAFRAGTAPELAVAGTASGSPSTGGTRADLSAFPIRINRSYAGATGNSFVQLVRVWEQDDIGSSGIAEATS